METTAAHIETPALLIDLDIMERNLSRMQEKAAQRSVRLRPHVKTHKSPQLARMQISRGAAGITVAKSEEALVMAEAGIDHIFIAHQVVSREKIQRLVTLTDRVRLSVGLDSAEGARRLSAEFSANHRSIDYVVEIDSGLHRCGLPPGEAAAALFREIRELPGIRFSGVFTHGGHAYGAESIDRIKEIAMEESAAVVDSAAHFERMGVPCETVSVGSTPTMRFWDGFPGVTEIRPGNYIFNDGIQVALGSAAIGDCALTVKATVVSRPAPDRAVIDAGAKSLTSDKGAHGKAALPGYGIVVGKPATLVRLSEEHGVLQLAETDPTAVGDTMRIIPNHACTAMNLFDTAYGIRNGQPEMEIDIAARGRLR